MVPVRLSAALICILNLALTAVVPTRCVELHPECNTNYGYECSDKLDVDENDQLNMNVDCASGSVSWHRVPGMIISAFDITVKVECENLTRCYDAEDTTDSSVKLLDLPLNNTGSCVFRICYNDFDIADDRQVHPQYCNYTEFPVTSILPSTTNFNIQTQTVNLTTSSKSQMVLHVLSTVFNNTQTRTTKSSEESASPIGPSNTPFPSITTDTLSIVLITLGIITVLIVVCVSLFSVTLTLKIKKSVRFSESKGTYEMTTISEEEIFIKGFDTIHKGMTGSCTSLVTIVQPLEKDDQPNIDITPLMSVSENDTRKNIESKEECNQSSTSVTLQSELFEKTTLPPVKPFDIKAGIEDDDCGYLEYNDRFSHQYLSFYSSKCSSYNALDAETYDDISVCSQLQ